MRETHGLDVDPLTDIAICCGQSEAFAAAVLASMPLLSHYLITNVLFCSLFHMLFVACFVGTVIDPGDEVIIFDPSYETYQACVAMAGGIPVCFFNSVF